MSCLIDICKEIFVLKVKSPVLLEVVSILVILRRECCSFHLFHVYSSHFVRRDGAWSEWHWFLLIQSTTANRSIVEVNLVSRTSPEAMGRWAVNGVLLHNLSSWQIYFFCREKYIGISIIIVRLRVRVCLTLYLGWVCVPLTPLVVWFAILFRSRKFFNTNFLF